MEYDNDCTTKKNQWSVHLRWVHFMVYKLYLNKVSKYNKNFSIQVGERILLQGRERPVLII